ncbi:MAG TPA: hypothetical protein VEB21_10215 [Terriglobales bacterium]|nr:hypothetical protein [Terriglobales bacterium]
MRRLQWLVGLSLLVGLSFSSCECRKEAPPRPADSESNAGFKLTMAVPAVTPQRTLAVATPTSGPEPSPTFLSELPKDFPSEVPVYEGANLMQAQPMANDAQNVLFSVKDNVANVRAFYHKKMTDQGFEMTQEFDRGNHAFATFKKGDLLVNVTVAEDARNPGQQVIAVMYEREKPLPFEEF